MTNKEFYSAKLLAITLDDNCHKLYKAVYGENCMVGENCEGCEFYTVKDIENWLNAEHKEPPLLENGDGMKLGDWIIVRNREDQDWVKHLFAYYKDGLFWTLDVGFFDEIKIECWIQARLPMENK